MKVVVLGSGSRGNAVVVESTSGRRVLVDAGFSCRELEKRMHAVGIVPSSLSALILTHEHQDHVIGADRFARRHGLPIYATQGTLGATSLRPELRSKALRISSGVPVEVAGFELEPFSIPHDAFEPVGVVLTDEAGRRFGLAADLGYRSRLAWGRMGELDLVVLETNHDLEMLRSGPYPWPLKQRIAGRHGHLSNREAAEGLPELCCDRLRWVVLYHLSQTNNDPALALDAVQEALQEAGSAARAEVSFQDRPTPWLEVGLEVA
jgi:phosphoribosyl 1,2-cyclic phosphodiesterase